MRFNYTQCMVHHEVPPLAVLVIKIDYPIAGLNKRYMCSPAQSRCRHQEDIRQHRYPFPRVEVVWSGECYSRMLLNHYYQYYAYYALKLYTGCVPERRSVSIISLFVPRTGTCITVPRKTPTSYQIIASFVYRTKKSVLTEETQIYNTPYDNNCLNRTP